VVRGRDKIYSRNRGEELPALGAYRAIVVSRGKYNCFSGLMNPPAIYLEEG